MRAASDRTVKRVVHLQLLSIPLGLAGAVSGRHEAQVARLATRCAGRHTYASTYSGINGFFILILTIAISRPTYRNYMKR